MAGAFFLETFAMKLRDKNLCSIGKGGDESSTLTVRNQELTEFSDREPPGEWLTHSSVAWLRSLPTIAPGRNELTKNVH